MGTPNAIIEGFHEVRMGAIRGAELVPPYSFASSIIRQLNRARYSRRLRPKLRFIPHSLWTRWHVLRSLPLSNDQVNYIVIMPGTDLDRLILPKLLADVRNRPGVDVRLVLLLFDPIDSPLRANGWGRVCEIFPLFDLVATFDKYDAEQYGLMHFTDPYSSRTVEFDDDLATDLFFVGHEKGRLDRLCAIADRLWAADIDFRILVAGVTDMDKAVAHGLTPLKERMAYSEVLRHVVACHCLLEVLCTGQTSSSLRYYEAVVYGKKLLTDNRSVVELPKFNPDNIHIFDAPSDIDTDWIRDDRVVEYGYADEFSAARLMELIELATIDVRPDS